MNNLKSKVEKLESQAVKIKGNPQWRVKHAKDAVSITRAIEKAFGKPPKPEKDIIAAEKKYLSTFQNEAAYLGHLQKIEPSLTEIFKRRRVF